MTRTAPQHPDSDAAFGAGDSPAAAPTDPDAAARTIVAARLAIAVGRINRRIRPAGDGLSHGLLSALSTVARSGPMRPGDLARYEVVAAPTMTRALAELESRGLISRAQDPDDGRSFLIEATTAGAEAVLRARSERAERVTALLASCSEADIAAIAAALDALETAATAPATPSR
ncbi:MAG: MarR family transcriptional regulator [Microbacteriaceae bacterium]